MSVPLREDGFVETMEMVSERVGISDTDSVPEGVRVSDELTEFEGERVIVEDMESVKKESGVSGVPDGEVVKEGVLLSDKDIVHEGVPDCELLSLSEGEDIGIGKLLLEEEVVSDCELVSVRDSESVGEPDKESVGVEVSEGVFVEEIEHSDCNRKRLEGKRDGSRDKSILPGSALLRAGVPLAPRAPELTSMNEAITAELARYPPPPPPPPP